MPIETFSARAYCPYGYICIYILCTYCVCARNSKMQFAVCMKLLLLLQLLLLAAFPHCAPRTLFIVCLGRSRLSANGSRQSAGHAALQSAIAVNNASSYMSPSSWPLLLLLLLLLFASFLIKLHARALPADSQRVRVNDEGRVGHCGLVSCALFCSALFSACYQQTLSLLLKCRGL